MAMAKWAGGRQSHHSASSVISAREAARQAHGSTCGGQKKEKHRQRTIRRVPDATVRVKLVARAQPASGLAAHPSGRVSEGEGTVTPKQGNANNEMALNSNTSLSQSSSFPSFSRWQRGRNSNSESAGVQGDSAPRNGNGNLSTAEDLESPESAERTWGERSEEEKGQKPKQVKRPWGGARRNINQVVVSDTNLTTRGPGGAAAAGGASRGGSRLGSRIPRGLVAENLEKSGFDLTSRGGKNGKNDWNAGIGNMRFEIAGYEVTDFRAVQTEHQHGTTGSAINRNGSETAANFNFSNDAVDEKNKNKNLNPNPNGVAITINVNDEPSAGSGGAGSGSGSGSGSTFTSSARGQRAKKNHHMRIHLAVFFLVSGVFGPQRWSRPDFPLK